jgi:hypothetical protein
VEELRPVFEYDVELAPRVAICEKGPPDEVARSTLKPDSLFELSFQLRLIWLVDTEVAERPLGALGAVAPDWVVALAVLEKEDLSVPFFFVLKARTL